MIKKIKLLIKKVPILNAVLRVLYEKTPYYQSLIRAIARNKQAETETEALIMKNVFNNVFVVRNGCFQGMKYVGEVCGIGALLPKIFGSYEEPIQGWIDEIIHKKHYYNILDVGCAEGYYAVGLAMKLPDTKVMAYDIDENARNNLKKLIKLNKLNNVEIYEECSHGTLDEYSSKNTLVFCDIEGHEKELLDPVLVPNLKYSDILVESHDCFVEGITDTLINRFYETHKIRIIVDYPYRLAKYEAPNPISRQHLDYIINEKRSPKMKFLYMESILNAK